MAKVTLRGNVIKAHGHYFVNVETFDSMMETFGFLVGESVYLTIESCSDGTKNNNNKI